MEDIDFMKEALFEAEKAAKNGEVPVGAVVVLNGRIIGRGRNRREGGYNVCGHAEIEALRQAAQNQQRWQLPDCTIYVTLEPCLMCCGAILQSGLFRVVYGADDEKMGAICSNYHVFDAPTKERRPLVSRGLLAEESTALLREFFNKLRDE